MKKNEITVFLETITPLWTGDAWQKTGKIRPSSLMGSLRFWFEVICYFAGIVSKEDFDSGKGRFEKEINQSSYKEKLRNKGTDVDSQIIALVELGIPLPAIVFGTTGMRGLIEIKKIIEIKDYCFGNRLNLPKKICISKQNGEIKENNDCPGRSDRNWSVFYLSQPYFYGKLEVKFLIEEEILNNIFYPLLNFMDKYGYWGGKWNIGYGRMKVTAVKQKNDNKEWENVNNWEIKEFDFSLFKNGEKFDLEKCRCLVKNFSELIQGDKKKIKIILDDKLSNKNLKEVLKQLIKQKIKERITVSEKEERHNIFGTIKAPPEDSLPQGAKVLPYVTEKGDNYCGGFLSIAGLLDLL